MALSAAIIDRNECFSTYQCHFIDISGFLAISLSGLMSSFDDREGGFIVTYQLPLPIRVKSEECQQLPQRNVIGGRKRQCRFFHLSMIVIYILSYTRWRSRKAHLLYHVIDAGRNSNERFHFDVQRQTRASNISDAYDARKRLFHDVMFLGVIMSYQNAQKRKDKTPKSGNVIFKIP